MPYIDKQAKLDMDLMIRDEKTVGELNYVLTRTILNFLDRTPKKYQNYNDVIGVLECAKLELYRRMVAPYEDGKCLLNGDVYV